MSLYIASGEQEKILKSELSLANITYVDKNVAIHTIALSVINQWKDGHSSIIIMPEENDRALLEDYLHKMGVGSLLLSISLQNTVNEKELGILRKSFQPVNSIPPNKYEEYPFLLNKFSNKVIEFFDQRYSKQDQGETWRTLLDKYLILRPNVKASILQRNINSAEFDFTLDEMARIRPTIVESLLIYQRDFEISETLQMHHLLHKDARHPHKLEEVTYKLFTFKEVAEVLRDSFNACYFDLETNYLQVTFQIVDEIIAKIERFKDRLANDPIGQKKSSVFQIFSGEQKQISANIQMMLTEWNEIISSLTDIKVIKKSNYKEVPHNSIDLLNHFLTLLNAYKDKKVIQKKEYLKSINRFNLNNTVQNDLENDLQSLTNQINQSNILNQKLEINTLSFAKQLDFITDLVYQIEIILLKIEKNIHYYQWTSFFEDCSIQEKEVLANLKLIDPTDWIHSFDCWYYHEMLTKDYAYLTSNEELQYHTILKAFEIATSAETDSKVKSHSIQIKQNLDLLKKNNPELYLALVKNKTLSHPTLWKYCLSQHNAFFSSVFPIIIVDEAHLEQLSELENQHLYIFEKNNLNPDILQLFKSVNAYYLNASFKGNANFNLSHHTLSPGKKLAEITVSERLPLVRSLCDIILSTDKQPVVFQLRDATIVSYASSYINQCFEHNLYDLGIKKILSEHTLYESLLGALLDSERNIYIITEDGMFDHFNTDLILWQLHCHQLIKKIGCQVLNIDTSELLITKGKSFQPLLDLIINNQKTGSRTDLKQLSVEFN